MLQPRIAVTTGLSFLSRRANSTSAAAIPTIARNEGGKPRLVVLGSGWAGYNVARLVDKSLYDVFMVSPNSYFSFTPFLASTAVGTLEYRCATEPVRGIKHINFRQGWANGIDLKNRSVQVEPALPPVADAVGLNPIEAHNKLGDLPEDKKMGKYNLEYDKLVISVGCYSASFGIPGVSKYAHFLKDIRDARAIRNKVLERFEQALHPSMTQEEREKLLRFSVVGGGPTGVEFAAELHDFVQEDVYRLFPELTGLVKIQVYDVAPGILMNFDKSLREYAEQKFSREGVEVRPNSKITAVGEDWLEVDSGDGAHKEPFGLLVWSTGLSPNPLMKALTGLSRDEKTHSIKVDEYLSVLDSDVRPVQDVFAIGDNAMPVSGPLPATAQVAAQMAKYTAHALNAAAKGAKPKSRRAFRWKNRGSMVLIGEKKGLLDRSGETIEGPRSRLAGFAAWFIWRSYYMTLALGWRSKILIPVYWSLSLLFGRDFTRF